MSKKILSKNSVEIKKTINSSLNIIIRSSQSRGLCLILEQQRIDSVPFQLLVLSRAPFLTIPSPFAANAII
jgi:hypothetical protein